ncbi:hypothetical protein UFOVP449_62 [uncultured Caudovirales phage]|uniref:Uncharacterized protein n=1 Tax=uncultured Caudovirales phage TaxID=2100421 RepID=A0A6J5MBC1_9CAUD|nr:hypothetical protein UFOVP449_62 [uncultured Caudovirales phage]
MPRKKSSNQYFTQDTENAIIEYNSTDNKLVKDRIYKERISPAFNKLAEIVYNKWKFTYFDDNPEDVMSEVVAFMIEKIHMYRAGKGKAFSYFTIVARNYLILNNNANYKRYKDTDVMSSMPESWDTENNFREEVRNEDHKSFNKRMLAYWDRHLEEYFPKKRDVQIADAILELFRRAEYIENFNKKSLYLLVREMTGYPTHYITKIVNRMKEKQLELYNEFDKTGDIII